MVGINTQARKTERITLAVTPDELKAARYVARIRETEESPLVRDKGLPWVVREYRRLKAIEKEEAGR